MSALEQLRPFVCLFQACGFIPYTVEYDQIAKKPTKFTFSWMNFTTWWFILLAILQVVIPAINSQITGEKVDKLSVDKQTPVTVTLLFGVIALCFVVQIVLLRWIVLRPYRRWQNAFKLALQVETLLQRDNYYLFQSHLNRRFIVEFTLVAINVKLQLQNLFNTYHCEKENYYYLILQSTGASIVLSQVIAPRVLNQNSIAIICLFCVQTLEGFTTDGPLLLLNLSLFVIAHYIKALRSKFGNVDNENSSKNDQIQQRLP